MTSTGTELDRITLEHLRAAVRLAQLADEKALVAAARIGRRLIEHGEHALWDGMKRCELLPGDVVSKREARQLLELKLDRGDASSSK